MTDKVQDYISKSLKKESDFWLDIAKEKTRQYPKESMRQIIIRTMIAHFEQKFPDVMEEFDNEIKKKRELSKNVYASDSTTDMRRLSAIPDGLLTRINKTFTEKEWPRFLSEQAQKEYQELDWFLKEYPRFMVPEIY